jgi:hypothetical protein
VGAGERIDGISEEPSASRTRRPLLAAAALLGGAVVGLAWLFLGGGGGASTTSFQVSPGIPPVMFLYLDNGQIASYLAQLQGGAATTETLSQQATQERNASISANGVGAGASATRQSAAELSLTVNNQSRFADLLGLLGARGYLHTIDMAARDRVVKREFATVPVGDFVKLSQCTVTLPLYVQYEQLWRATEGRIGVRRLAEQNGPKSLEKVTIQGAIGDRAVAEGKNRPPQSFTGSPSVSFPVGALERGRAEMNRLVRRVGANPRVPLTTCGAHGVEGYDPAAPDLLMPIRLGRLSSDQSALAGRVTLVGKVVLAIRRPGADYVDQATLQQWSGAAFWTAELGGANNLQDTATVLAPAGYVIQPIAIYK